MYLVNAVRLDAARFRPLDAVVWHWRHVGNGTDSDTFGSFIDIILPLVSKTDGQGFFIYELNKSEIVDLFPEKILALLYAVLPEYAPEWPHGTGDTLKRIGEVNPVLLKDKRLIELRTRFGS